VEVEQTGGKQADGHNADQQHLEEVPANAPAVA
jgi:hypothetical protein